MNTTAEALAALKARFGVRWQIARCGRQYDLVRAGGMPTTATTCTRTRRPGWGYLTEAETEH